MADTGLEENFVDTQGVSLTNETDDLTYIQLTNVNFQIDNHVEKHQLTDGSVDNIFSLYMNYIEANITVTTLQIAALVALTVDLNGVRPSKVWKLGLNDSDDKTTTISINGQVKTLRFIDIGVSVVKLFIRIEGDEVLSVA